MHHWKNDLDFSFDRKTIPGIDFWKGSLFLIVFFALFCAQERYRERETRMSGGRGRGRGRGGGRGGRGRGRGRFGGRMGGGRGGGRMIQQQQRIPNYLNFINQYNAFSVLSFLSIDDRKSLGQAYPRFDAMLRQQEQQQKRQQQLRQQQQKLLQQRRKQQQQDSQQTSGAEVEEEEEEVCTAPSLDPAKILEEVDEKVANGAIEELLGEKVETKDETNNDKDEATSELNDENKEGNDSSTKPTATEPTATADAKVSNEQSKPKPSVSDPHTLLARLNSKRLYRRIRFLQKRHKDANGNMDDFDPKEAFPLNKTTEQIAIQEWQGLLSSFKDENIRKMQEAQRMAEQLIKEEEGGETQDDVKEEKKSTDLSLQQLQGQSKSHYFPLPSDCELLLFSPCPRAVAVLASYPRSGNSLMRNLYERTTLRVTGSDMRGGLTKHDLVGEAATQTNCVQFVKTHFPERRGTPPFLVSRAVLVVRNPYDAMWSYFNLMMSNEHTKSLTEEQRVKSAHAFAEMAKKEILVWRDFHEYWLQQKIPILVVRYEDLIRYTDKVMSKVIKFVLEINDMKFFESRIDRCIREEQIENLGSYKPRSGGIGRSLKNYPPELLQTINTGIFSTMEKYVMKELARCK